MRSRSAGHHGWAVKAPGAIAVLALAVSMLIVSTPQTADAVPATVGTDFWVGFQSNIAGDPTLTLFISGGSATSGTVTPKGMAGIHFTVTPGHVTSVLVPTSYMASATDGIEEKGIHITSGAPVTVYGLNRYPATTDAYLAIPTASLGTNYRVMSYVVSGFTDGLQVIGTQNGTTVTITPKVAMGSHPAGVAYHVTVNQGQSYQLLQSGDVTGTIVTASHPISVYGFANCTDIPEGTQACDHIDEQMPPTSSWGTDFLAARLATRTRGDTYRVLANQANTVVTVNGSTVATLGAGEFYNAILPTGATTAANQGLQIKTSKPALVAQFSNSTTYDGVTSDPFMMLVPPFEQFESSYTVTTPASGFDINYINVVVKSSAISTFKLDGATVSSTKFAAIGTSGYSSAQLAVALGTHNLSDPQPFGVFVYGFAEADSYGYPGGYTLAPVASVSKLTLDKPAYSANTGTNVCPVATVRDSSGAALAGITVHFVVDKPTAIDTTAVTNSAGQATVCFTSKVAGSGELTATAGVQASLLSAHATVAFGTAAAPPPVQQAPAFTG
jgi:IgGFc binding protein/Bacterial Ig-like domain (group 1)